MFEAENLRFINKIQEDLRAKIDEAFASPRPPSQQDVENFLRHWNDLQNRAAPNGPSGSATPLLGVGATAPVSQAAGYSSPGNGVTHLPSGSINNLSSVVKRNSSVFI